MTNTELLKAVYQAADKKDFESLAVFFAQDIHFRFANTPAIEGKAAVLAANIAFFANMPDIEHVIENIWSQGDEVICHGLANIKKTETELVAIPFATRLKVNQGKISQYQVYTDLSPLSA